MKKLVLFFLLVFIQKMEAQNGLTRLLEQAQVRIGGGDPTALHEAADRLVATFTNDFNGYALKGIAFFQQNDAANGERLLRESIAKNTRDPYRGAIDMLNEYSNFFGDAGQSAWFALLDDCTQKWNPAGWEGWAMKAYRVALEEGRADEAVGYFRKAREVAASPADKLAAGVEFIAFMTDAGKLDEAREAAAALPIDQVKSVEQLAALSGAFIRLGEKKRAVEVFEKMLVAKIDWQEAYELLANLYGEMGMLEEKCRTYYRWMTIGKGKPAVSADCLHPAKMLNARPGQTLVFEVTTDAAEYPFLVKINEFSSETIAFEWKMGNSTISTGSVRMDKTALEKAASLVSFFNNGEKSMLTDRTAVWVSRLIFSQMDSPGGVAIDWGKGPETFVPERSGSANFWFENRYASLPTRRSRAEKGSQIHFLNNAANPLITRFKGTDFEVNLTEIQGQ